ncbi:MAG: metal ABC transporter permease [Bacilli bacterium]
MSHELTILIIASLVAIACSTVGTFLVLRKMAMIGDAISHSILPGIVIAFFITGSRDSFSMMLGALVFGLVAVFLIQTLQRSGVQNDASIGVVFTALFAVGVLLVSLYAEQVDLDLDCVLYGEIAYAPWDTWTVGSVNLGSIALWQVGFAALLNVLILTLFYKQFKIVSFDAALALSMGIPVALFHYVLMGLVSVTTISAFESVGAILVVGMLVVPPATAYLLTERLSTMLVLSCIIGVISSIGGYYVAALTDTAIAGCIVAVSGALFFLTLLFSPTHGILFKALRARKMQSVS